MQVFSENVVLKKRHLWAVNCAINIKKGGLDSGGEDMAGFFLRKPQLKNQSVLAFFACFAPEQVAWFSPEYSTRTCFYIYDILYKKMEHLDYETTHLLYGSHSVNNLPEELFAGLLHGVYAYQSVFFQSVTVSLSSHTLRADLPVLRLWLVRPEKE